MVLENVKIKTFIILKYYFKYYIIIYYSKNKMMIKYKDKTSITKILIQIFVKF